MRGYRFNLKGFVADLGGPTQVYRMLKDMGVDVKPRTVNKWLERDDIAVVYLVNLMAHVALDEGPMDLNRYILPARDGPVRPRTFAGAPAPEPAPAPPCRTAVQG